MATKSIMIACDPITLNISPLPAHINNSRNETNNNGKKTLPETSAQGLKAGHDRGLRIGSTYKVGALVFKNKNWGRAIALNMRRNTYRSQRTMATLVANEDIRTHDVGVSNGSQGVSYDVSLCVGTTTIPSSKSKRNEEMVIPSPGSA